MNSFSIALGLFFICFKICRGASLPEPGNNAPVNPWKNLMDPSKGENHGLQESVTIFTDHKLMPFIVPCYSEECCEKPEQVLCSSYYELMMAVNASSNVSTFNVTGIRDSVANSKEMTTLEAEKFCKYFGEIFTNYNVTWGNMDLKQKIQNTLYCSLLCITTNGATTKLYVKPMCNAMTLMSAALQNAPSATKSTVQQPSAIGSKLVQVPESAKIHVDRESGAKLVEHSKMEVSGLNSNKPAPKSNKKEEDTSNKTTTVPHVQAGPEQKPVPTHEKITDNLKNEQPAEIMPKTLSADNIPKALPADNMPKAPPAEKGETVNQPPKDVEKQESKIEMPQEAVQGSVTSQLDVGLDEQFKEDNNIPVKANDQRDDPNRDLYDENTDDQKSEQKNYSDEKDVDEFNQPQADTQQTLKDTTLEELIERKSHKIMTQTNDGVSANYLPASDPFYEESGSNFFTYFLAAMFVCILLYVLYHNKTKVLALILEGRRGQKGRNGRRKHTAQYRKLDTNLEEAITSSASGRSSQIIY